MAERSHFTPRSKRVKECVTPSARNLLHAQTDLQDAYERAVLKLRDIFGEDTNLEADIIEEEDMGKPRLYIFIESSAQEGALARSKLRSFIRDWLANGDADKNRRIGFSINYV